MSDLQIKETTDPYERADNYSTSIEFSVDKTRLGGFILTITDYKHTDGKMRTIEGLTQRELMQLSSEIDKKVLPPGRVSRWNKNIKIGKWVLNIGLWR